MQPLTGHLAQRGTIIMAAQARGPVNTGFAMVSKERYVIADRCTLSVCDIQLNRRYGEFGGLAGASQFVGVGKLCISPVSGNILAVDVGNMRVYEFTLDGAHVRCIGEGLINVELDGIAANMEVIAVGAFFEEPSEHRIFMLDQATGELIRKFGPSGSEPGQLPLYCGGLRFTPDNRCIVVTECTDLRGRVSVFTVEGDFVRCFGQGLLRSPMDVEFADNGDLIVGDLERHCIFAFSITGDLLRQWYCEGPIALCNYNAQLFVLQMPRDQYMRNTEHIQVFEPTDASKLVSVDFGRPAAKSLAFIQHM